ncbi:uncharacterized protein LOC123531649 [Mercenaria mercenaria]|uniref:uncharacterized protein LOC123531649 n=1 Tax=Mercenaria mercenaria TaxID=6596 RepID=UPI001E1DD3FC|nr:uncharacterized protein LOC123531649 [Mercenaria mercenaria]
MGEEYRRNNTAHSHTADPSLLYKKELDIKVKDEASRHVFRSACDIVKTAMSDRGQLPNPPKVTNMQRKANRHRQRLKQEGLMPRYLSTGMITQQRRYPLPPC